MKTLYLYLVLALVAPLISSCTLTATAYPVKGPAANEGVILEPRFTYAGGGAGKVSVDLPSGEHCSGRYATVVGGVVSPLALEHAPDAAAASVDSGRPLGLQTSRAILVGNQGTMIDFEGYTSGANPRHGFGVARDNHGSVWKLIW